MLKLIFIVGRVSWRQSKLTLSIQYRKKTSVLRRFWDAFVIHHEYSCKYKFQESRCGTFLNLLHHEKQISQETFFLFIIKLLESRIAMQYVFCEYWLKFAHEYDQAAPFQVFKLKTVSSCSWAQGTKIIFFYISIMLKAVAFSNRSAQLKTWKPRNRYTLSSAITLIWLKSKKISFTRDPISIKQPLETDSIWGFLTKLAVIYFGLFRACIRCNERVIISKQDRRIS